MFAFFTVLNIQQYEEVNGMNQLLAHLMAKAAKNDAETAAATDSVIGDLVDQEAAPDRADRGATPSNAESGPDRGVIDDLLGGGDR